MQMTQDSGKERKNCDRQHSRTNTQTPYNSPRNLKKFFLLCTAHTIYKIDFFRNAIQCRMLMKFTLKLKQISCPTFHSSKQIHLNKHKTTKWTNRNEEEYDLCVVQFERREKSKSLMIL